MSSRAAEEVQYLTDERGRLRAVVLPAELWNRLLPRDEATVEELREAVEGYCLDKAIDEGRTTPLLSRDEALKFLDRRLLEVR